MILIAMVWEAIRKNVPLVTAVFTILSGLVGTAIRIEHRFTVLEAQYNQLVETHRICEVKR